MCIAAWPRTRRSAQLNKARRRLGLLDSSIAWAATSGATNAGGVYFEPSGADRTRVTLSLEYEPEGLVETAGAKLGIVERQAAADVEAGAGAAQLSTTRLRVLGGLTGVGLISGSEQINFEPAGLTLVYGPNAVGKSSYVRALKVLCRTVDRDCKVLSNIFDKQAPAAASARVEYEVDGAVTAQRTSLNAAAAVRLTGLSVFDSACAELYVNSQNVVHYIPPELRLLARLAALHDALRRELAAEADALRATAPSIAEYPPTTSVGRALAALSPATTDADLAALSEVSEEQQERLLVLRGAVAAAAASTSRDDASAAQREAQEASTLGAARAE